MSFRPIRVLVADDTPEIRMLLKVNLEVDGRFVVVAEAAEGAEAIRLVTAHRPDAVVLDLAMPILDGLQAIPMIRKSSPHTKIAVLSGFTAQRMEDKALECGADRYLEKGVAFEQIAAVLSDLCAPNGDAMTTAPAVEIRSREPLAGPEDEAVELLAHLGHELQTPVAAIEIMSAMLTRALDRMPPDAIESTASSIHRTAMHLTSLIQTLSEVRAVDRGTVRLVTTEGDIGTFVADVVNDLAWYTNPHPVNIESEQTVVVAFDPVRIRQIVTNVVINAANYSPAAAPIDVAIRQAGGWAEVHVTDSGPGIAKGRENAIFEKFVRDEGRTTGMGLGLYISRGIARVHGGDLTFERVPGRGARFVLKLPGARA